MHDHLLACFACLACLLVALIASYACLLASWLTGFASYAWPIIGLFCQPGLPVCCSSCQLCLFIAACWLAGFACYAWPFIGLFCLPCLPVCWLILPYMPAGWLAGFVGPGNRFPRWLAQRRNQSSRLLWFPLGGLQPLDEIYRLGLQLFILQTSDPPK